MDIVASDTLPPEVIASLWGYDAAQLKPVKHKRIIIEAVLNHGTKAATDWLFTRYSSREIKEVAEAVPRGAWDKRSLALWSLVLGFTPKARQERFAQGRV